MNLGAPELLIMLLVVLVLFGGAKLPNLARSLGQLVARHGAAVVPHVDAAVDALSAGAG